MRLSKKWSQKGKFRFEAVIEIPAYFLIRDYEFVPDESTMLRHEGSLLIIHDV